MAVLFTMTLWSGEYKNWHSLSNTTANFIKFHAKYCDFHKKKNWSKLEFGTVLLPDLCEFWCLHEQMLVTICSNWHNLLSSSLITFSYPVSCLMSLKQRFMCIWIGNHQSNLRYATQVGYHHHYSYHVNFVHFYYHIIRSGNTDDNYKKLCHHQIVYWTTSSS